jgi:hypothetical protein
MMLLTKDQELFERKYEEAARFLRAAQLRKECYALAKTTHRSPWGNQRLSDLLLNTPACHEPWFIVQLRGDCNQEIDNLLTKMGY